MNLRRSYNYASLKKEMAVSSVSHEAASTLSTSRGHLRRDVVESGYRADWSLNWQSALLQHLQWGILPTAHPCIFLSNLMGSCTPNGGVTPVEVNIETQS